MPDRRETAGIRRLLKESWMLQTALVKPVFKHILLMAIFLIPIGYFNAVAVSGYMFMEGVSRYIAAYFVLAIYVVATMVLFLVKGVPCMMVAVKKAHGVKVDFASIKASCHDVKEELYKVVLALAIVVAVVEPGSIFLMFPDSLDQLIVRHVIYAAFIPLLWLPIHFLAIPLIVNKKLTARVAVYTAYKTAARYWRQIIFLYLLLIVASVIFFGVLFGLAHAVSYVSPLVSNFLSTLLLVFPYFALVLPLTPLWYAVGGVLYRRAC